MLREVNSHVLVDLKITAHQFMILFMILDGMYAHLDEYLKSNDSYKIFNEDLKKLSELSLLTYDSSNVYNYKAIVVTPSFMKRVAKYDFFDELYTAYPTKISRPDGSVDYLRKDRHYCEQVYSIITKSNPDIHDHIMRCLRAELKQREASGTINYMKRLSNWITKREWENYADIVDNNTELKEDNTYGTALE